MFADVSPLLIVLLLKKRLSIKIASFLFLSKSKKIGLDIESKPKSLRYILRILKALLFNNISYSTKNSFCSIPHIYNHLFM